MPEVSGVIVTENLNDSKIFVALYEGGSSYLALKEECQLSKGDVIFGRLQTVGDQKLFNESKGTDFQVSILMVRRGNT